MSGERLIRPARTGLTRRKLLIGLGVGAAAAPLSACSFDTGSPAVLNILEKAEALTKAGNGDGAGISARRDLGLFQAERVG
jgi:hypothetical protein